jgi:hypothetical protein
MIEPLLANPRSLTARVAAALGGTAIDRPQLTGFLNSEFDPFLNQLYAAGPVTPREAAEALEGRPGFIWLAEEPSPSEVAPPGTPNLLLALMQGMTATTSQPMTAPRIEGEIVEVRSGDELQAWHEVYCEVFGADDRTLHDWQPIHHALGPAGDRSLSLLLARVDARPPQPPPSTSSPTSRASTASRHASACVVGASPPRSCTHAIGSRRHAASSGRSYKRQPWGGRSTPKPDTRSRGDSQFWSPGACDALKRP